MEDKLTKTEDYYIEYTCPRTGKKKRDPWLSNQRCNTKEALFSLTEAFVYLMIEERGKDYLDGVMKKAVEVVANGKTLCIWCPMRQRWIDYV